MNDGNTARDPVYEDEVPDDQLPTDVLAAEFGTTAEIPENAHSAQAPADTEFPQRVTAPLTLPESPARAAAQMASRGQMAVEYLRCLGNPLIDHYVLEILEREAEQSQTSLWFRRYADLLLVAQDRLFELLPVNGPYLDDQARRYLAREVLYLSDWTASIVVSYLDVSAEQHIKSAYKGWFAADLPPSDELSPQLADERRNARRSQLELFRAELDSIKMRLYESFLANITVPLGQLVASLDKCATELQRDFYLGMIAYGAPVSLISMASSSAELFPREMIGEFEFDLVLRDREVSDTSTRQRVAVTLVDGSDFPGSDFPDGPVDTDGFSDPSEPSRLSGPGSSSNPDGPSDAAEALRALEARDRERTLARYGWTGLVFTDREVASDLRACVEQVCQTYQGPSPGSDTRTLRRGYSRRFST